MGGSDDGAAEPSRDQVAETREAAPLPSAALQPQGDYDSLQREVAQQQQRSNWVGAAMALERAIRVAPDRVASKPEVMSSHYTNLGAFRIMSGDYAGAAAALEMASKLDSQNEDAMANLGLAYLYQNRRGDAEKAFRQALELAPQNATAKAGLQQCLGVAGK